MQPLEMSHAPRRTSYLDPEYGCRRSALHNACVCGDLETVRHLAFAGRDSVDAFGRTALHRAAAAGQLDVVRWLVTEEGGYDPAAPAHNGRNALHEAVVSGHGDVVRALLTEPITKGGVGGGVGVGGVGGGGLGLHNPELARARAEDGSDASPAPSRSRIRAIACSSGVGSLLAEAVWEPSSSRS